MRSDSGGGGAGGAGGRRPSILDRIVHVVQTLTPRLSWPPSPAVSTALPTPPQSRTSELFLPAGDKDLYMKKDLLRSLQIGLVGNFARFWIEYLNTTHIYDHHKLKRAVYERPPGVGLITVMNHNSELDEPCVVAAMCGPGLLFDSKYMRWVFCAFDVCFKNKYSAAFFGNGKALPLHRGGGIDQPEMDAAVRKISKGDWVHIFPEGRVTQKGGVMGPMRAGVGRMVLESSPRPWIVPIFHLGMQEVRPLNKGPQVGKTVQVIIGDPFSVDDIIEHHAKLGSPRMTVYKAIARRCGVELEKLHVELVARLRENEAAARGGDDVDDEEGDEDDSGAEPAATTTSAAAAAAAGSNNSSNASGSATKAAAVKPAGDATTSKASTVTGPSASSGIGTGGGSSSSSSSSSGGGNSNQPGSGGTPPKASS